MCPLLFVHLYFVPFCLMCFTLSPSPRVGICGVDWLLHTGLAQFYAHLYIAWIFIDSLYFRQPNYSLLLPIGRQYELSFDCLAGEFRFVSLVSSIMRNICHLSSWLIVRQYCLFTTSIYNCVCFAMVCCLSQNLQYNCLMILST